MSVSDRIAEELVFSDLEVHRVEASERARILGMIKALEKDLARALIEADPLEVEMIGAREARIRGLQEEIRRLTRQVFRSIDRTSTGTMAELITVIGEDTQNVVNGVVGMRILLTPRVKGRELAEQLIVRGHPTREWWDAQAEGLTRRFIQEVREGARQDGATLDAIIRRTMGTRSRRGRDGILEISRRQAEAMVRTSMQAATNEARMAVYEENRRPVVCQVPPSASPEPYRRKPPSPRARIRRSPRRSRTLHTIRTDAVW